MKIVAYFVVISEWVAFLCWLAVYKKITDTKHKLFTIYLGLIAITELLNFLFSSTLDSIFNYAVRYLIIPLQFVFILYYLLYNHEKKNKILMSVFIIFYTFFFFVDNMHMFTLPINFDSLSYGIGNLLLIASLIIAIIRIFNQHNFILDNQNTVFFIYAGLIIFYIGSFPYENFRNYFWSKSEYYSTAYVLHYLSQAFNCIMYLLFGYAIKWKVK